MNINPCPNPECKGEKPPDTTHYLSVNCPSCGLESPCEGTLEENIAAWNSISMGWRKPETAPKDGTLIQATMRTAKWVHVLWIERSPDVVDGEESGWFCPESGVEYWESDLLGWRSIPPLPEGKP